MDDRRLLTEQLPDIPRWVEARSLLLDGDPEITGLSIAGELSAVIRDPEDDTVFVVGVPDPDAILAAVARRTGACDVVCGIEAGDRLARLAPDWTPQPAIIHEMAGEGRLPAPEGCAFIGLAAIARTPMEDELREELRDAARRTEIAASLVDGAPVAFCYAGAVTETLWDVGIDTLPAHRRAGHAAGVAAFVIGHMAARDKRPVWASLVDNPASWRLARKLGFQEVDRIMIFGVGAP
jgi:RimJ/RimL family protein N-acetyltransferase